MTFLGHIAHRLQTDTGMSGYQQKTLPSNSLVWIYCLDYDGVQENEQADLLTSRAKVVGTLMVGKGDVKTMNVLNVE